MLRLILKFIWKYAGASIVKAIQNNKTRGIVLYFQKSSYVKK
jgi:hypothetical protein